MKYIKEKKIGITGSTGILGSTISRYFKNNKIIFFKKDITKSKIVNDWIKKNDFDLIFHFAAIVPLNIVNKNKKYALSVNYHGTKNLINAINNYTKKKVWFFFSSTSHVYAKGKIKVNEKSPKIPINYYGYTKLLAENYIIKNKKNYEFCIGRIFSFSSIKQKKSFLIPSLVNKILISKNKNVYIENSSSVRDFLTVEEICNAITKLAKKNKRGIYNICSSNGVEIIKIVNFLNRFKRKKIKIISNKKNDFLVGDNSKIKKVGFKPSNKSWKLIINSFKKVN